VLPAIDSVSTAGPTMGAPTPPSPALLLLAAFSRHEPALAWARDRAEAAWGPVALESPAFEFVATEYYQATMGPDLKKRFFGFERLVDPGQLVDVKLQTNAWETEYAQSADHPEPRPLNLDPGYVTLGKLVLASTKDHAHRIYLARGICAEVTLYYRHRRWHHHEWTFPDYRGEDYQEFFTACRQYLHRRFQEEQRT
jgi:hypothetical protein